MQHSHHGFEADRSQLLKINNKTSIATVETTVTVTVDGNSVI